MNKNESSYNSTMNKKFTYLLGAGASFNSIPILEGQGKSMMQVANSLQIAINDINLFPNSKSSKIFENEKLLNFKNNLFHFGKLANEYGSIDIYARRLSLLGNFTELNNLKYCLSVYFDLWETFFGIKTIQNESKKKYFDKIDKRYFSLLSVLLEKNDQKPKLNNNISFISWNYDLQLEKAYSSFLPTNNNTLEVINSGIKFIDDESDQKQDIIHLNGYRGEFKYENKRYPTVDINNQATLEDYLFQLLDNEDQFRKSELDYKECIKYAWEADSILLKKAKKIMQETDVLIVIGYSFPSFNRKIDSMLIKAFEDNNRGRVIYQDPNANQDIINSIFSNPNDVKIEKDNINQFYIPHEFLYQTDDKEVYV